MTVDQDLYNGQLMESLLDHDGWKLIDTWMENRKKAIGSSLATTKFHSLDEVVKLQAELDAYSKLGGHVRHIVDKGRQARKKVEEQG